MIGKLRGRGHKQELCSQPHPHETGAGFCPLGHFEGARVVYQFGRMQPQDSCAVILEGWERLARIKRGRNPGLLLILRLN